MNTILSIILATIGVGSLIAYLLRDKSQDAAKQQAFINSITVGLVDKSTKP